MATYSTLYDYCIAKSSLPDPYGEQNDSSSLTWDDHAGYALEFKEYEVYGHKDQIYFKNSRYKKNLLENNKFDLILKNVKF